MTFQFKRNRTDKLSREKIISELEIVAEKTNYFEFGKRDFNKLSKISVTSVVREFGSWSNALSFLRVRLNEKGLDLIPRKEPPNRLYSDKQLFDEMERIWRKLGHRPSRKEWQSSKPVISYQTYTHRFNGWINACLKFIEYKSGNLVYAEPIKIETHAKTKKIERKDVRDIPLKLRLEVLKRDKFKCIFCGRSPATDSGVILHIDHVIPFSKGGKTELRNLQVLCSECNIGKSYSRSPDL